MTKDGGRNREHFIRESEHSIEESEHFLLLEKSVKTSDFQIYSRLNRCL
jgi:hypothetical protein